MPPFSWKQQNPTMFFFYELSLFYDFILVSQVFLILITSTSTKMACYA